MHDVLFVLARKHAADEVQELPRKQRVAGKVRKVTIGVAGQTRPDGHRWTVQLAKQEAGVPLDAPSLAILSNY